MKMECSDSSYPVLPSRAETVVAHRFADCRSQCACETKQHFSFSAETRPQTTRASARLAKLAIVHQFACVCACVRAHMHACVCVCVFHMTANRSRRTAQVKYEALTMLKVTIIDSTKHTRQVGGCSHCPVQSLPSPGRLRTA